MHHGSYVASILGTQETPNCQDQFRAREEALGPPELPPHQNPQGEYSHDTRSTPEQWGDISFGDVLHSEHGLGIKHLNIAGMNKEKLLILLADMRRGKTGVFFLTDIRCSGSELGFWKKQVRQALGPRANILMAPMPPMPGQSRSPRVGGCAVIINDYWGGRTRHWFVDDTKLGLILGINISLRGTDLLVMGTYWPTASTLPTDKPRHESGCLIHRIEEHMAKIARKTLRSPSSKTSYSRKPRTTGHPTQGPRSY